MALGTFQHFHLAGIPLILLGCVIFVPLYVLGIFIFNVFLHPLRSYPGPKLWAGFRFPYVYTQLRGLLPQRIKALHDQYGPVVRIAPNELSFIAPAAWNDIYCFGEGHSQLPKDLAMFPPIEKGAVAAMIMANDADHSRYRRLLSHAFSVKALKEQEPLVASYVDLLVQRLKERAAEPQDMFAWYNWTTSDIIGDLTFGEPFFGLRDQHWHPWVKIMAEGLQAGVVISAVRRYKLGFVFNTPMLKPIRRKYRQWSQYATDKVTLRLERGSERPDIISYVMRNDVKGREMSRLEMEANARLIVLAGSDAPAAHLSAATYYLCMDPQILGRITTEVRDAFDSDQDMSLESLKSLDYLLAIFNESLRLYPPAPGMPGRTVVNGQTIAGRWVPPGTIVGVWQWAAYHSASNFHDWESFVPERWLPDAPAEYKGDKKDVLHPFSTGPRNCIGKDLAYLEVLLTLAKILWNFDLSLEEESKNWTDKRILMNHVGKPLMVKLTPVERAEKVAAY